MPTPLSGRARGRRNADSLSFPHQPSTWIAASKYTGTKKWARRLQRQRIVQWPYIKHHRLAVKASAQAQPQAQGPVQSQSGHQHNNPSAGVDVLWETQTPSTALIAALQEVGRPVQLYQSSGRPKRDFSWLHPTRLRREKALFWRSKDRRKDDPGCDAGLVPMSLKYRVAEQPPRLSYATILADYIRKIEPMLRQELHSGTNGGCASIRAPEGHGCCDDPQGVPGTDPAEGASYPVLDLDQAISEVFSDEHLKYLTDRGYLPADAATWAWILMAGSPLRAMRRYDAYEQERVRHQQRQWQSQLQSTLQTQPHQAKQPVPLFVLLFIARQRDICPETLRLLITYASSITCASAQAYANKASAIADEQPEQTRRSVWNPWTDPDSLMILIIRLIRAARAVWPTALLAIAHIFTSILGSRAIAAYEKSSSRLQSDKFRRRLILQYNKLLDLISLPCNIHPFHSNTVQQRAQFHLLREMTEFEPPLIVSRLGFQAITRVQLAHRRTEMERDWAVSQLKSWPPWKEQRSGIDPLMGEGSQSRAARAIAYMVNAGYSLSVFDQAALLVAGWDSDGTPTVQTRTTLRRASAFELKHKPQRNPRIWAARVRATRTLKEAWACFLTYTDSGVRPHNDVYLAMAEKVVYHARTTASSDAKRADSVALPGDM
ncbi:hypothetical protein KEM52_002008, partial [Ascosphaera acerosa]